MRNIAKKFKMTMSLIDIETVDTVGNHGDLSNYQSDKILDFLSKF